ncbi:MAG TPA: hypothetical protein VGD91_31515 [Trebonia sp.]
MVTEGRWLCRTARGAWPDRNPVRRGTDRLEAYLLAGLLAAAALVMPLAAAAAGHASYLGALHIRQQQLATRHPARAVLTQGAAAVSGYAVTTVVPAPVTWTSADGTRRSGQVPVWAGSRAGSAVTVWTDRSGYLVSPPLEVSELAGEADAASIGAVAGVAAACAALAVATRQLLNRRRMAAWDADWLASARAWNRQSWQ